VTCHDGFTLNDLVSYQPKAQRANGEKIGMARMTIEPGIGVSRAHR